MNAYGSLGHNVHCHMGIHSVSAAYMPYSLQRSCTRCICLMPGTYACASCHTISISCRAAASGSSSVASSSCGSRAAAAPAHANGWPICRRCTPTLLLDCMQARVLCVRAHAAERCMRCLWMKPRSSVMRALAALTLAPRALACSYFVRSCCLLSSMVCETNSAAHSCIAHFCAVLPGRTQTIHGVMCIRVHTPCL